MILSGTARELWLSEQARSSASGSDDQLSWLLTAATLFPLNLDANIHLFRVLRSQNKGTVAAKLLTNLISKFSSAEIVVAELKSLADDADDEKFANLFALSTGDDVEKLEKAHALAVSIINNLPPDIQAVVKLKAVGSSGLSSLYKHADILCSALNSSYEESPNSFSEAFVSVVCADLLEKLLASSLRDVRRCLFDKVLPALFRTKSSDASPHPVVSKLPAGLVCRLLYIFIGHVLATTYNSSTASLLSIDRQWQPCLTLVTRIMFSSMNFPVPSIASPDEPGELVTLDHLTNNYLSLVEKLDDMQVDVSCEPISIILVMVLFRNITAYLRALLYPTEGEQARPVLLPSLSFLQNDKDIADTDIVWPGFDNAALLTALSSAFNIWHTLISIPSSTVFSRIPRRTEEILYEISSYFDEEDPLRYFDQFRTESFIYKRAFDHALKKLEPNQVSQRPQLVQRILCLAANGNVKEAAKIIMEEVLPRGVDFAANSANELDPLDLDLDAFSSSNSYFLIPISSKMLSHVTVSVLRKALLSFWPGTNPPLIVPLTLLVICQAENGQQNASFTAELVKWLYSHVTPQGNIGEIITSPADLVTPSRIQALLSIISSCVFRPELLEYVLLLVSESLKESARGAMETDSTSGSSTILSTITPALIAQLSSVTVSAFADTNAFALNYIRANLTIISSVLSTPK